MMSAVKSPMQNIVACLETEIKKCAGVPIVIPCVVFGSCLCLIPSMSVCGSFENQKMCGCTHIYTPCSLRKLFVFNTKQSVCGSFEIKRCAGVLPHPQTSIPLIPSLERVFRKIALRVCPCSLRKLFVFNTKHECLR